MFFGDRHHPQRETKELLNRRGKNVNRAVCQSNIKHATSSKCSSLQIVGPERPTGAFWISTKRFTSVLSHLNIKSISFHYHL